jgi:PKD repeat protein
MLHERTAGVVEMSPPSGCARRTFGAWGLTGTAETKIHVAPGNHYPVSDAGGPYHGAVGIPVQFDGTASSDPDGDALTYSWHFGDDAQGVGAQPLYTYQSAGTFAVSLYVRDDGTPRLTSHTTTTATIEEVFEARAFQAGGTRTIPLASAQHPETCFRIEPVGASYRNDAVRLATVTMRRADDETGPVIQAAPGKTAVVADQDRNGIDEVGMCFRMEDLRILFADIAGRTDVEVLIRGDLATGGYLEARTTLVVVGTGRALSAAVMPNPFNPEGTLVFRTGRRGPVTVRLYAPNGRLARRVWEASGVGAGYHEVRVDGRDDSGRPLPSGVYYYSIETAEGRMTGRVTLLK